MRNKKLAGFAAYRIHLVSDDIFLSILKSEKRGDKTTIFRISTNCTNENCTHTYTQFSNLFSAEQQLARFINKYSVVDPFNLDDSNAA